MSSQHNIQVTKNGHIIETRTASTAAGARRSLLAAVRRHNGNADTVDRQLAASRATAWDGNGPITVRLPAWNRNPAGSISVSVV